MQERQRVRAGVLLISIVTMSLLPGCSRQPEAEWEYSQAVQDLEDEDLRDVVVAQLKEHAGTRANPKLLGRPDHPVERLVQGRQVYQFYCQQCHGVTGGGDGPAAVVMRPRPRDYRAGIFKFTTTPYGSKPRRSDLMNTLKRGVAGTSMPSFRLLPEEELEAVVDYVLVLTHRGEYEKMLAEEEEAEFILDEDEGEDRDEYVQDLIDSISEKWDDAEGDVVYPLTPQPRFEAEHVEAGYQAFLRVGCIKCHGEDGRGQTAGNIGKDSWGFSTKAADLTSGMLHGGDEPMDIYRRIYAGINGTPMPSFANSLKSEPETLWNLVAYVKYLSNVRRNGVTPGAPSVPQPGESVMEAGSAAVADAGEGEDGASDDGSAGE